MDLRKLVLIKQQTNVLSDSLVNISNASLYESATEDGDSTLYYSFTNDSSKSIDCSFDKDTEKDEKDAGDSSGYSDGDKENTIIQRQSIPENRESETECTEVGKIAPHHVKFPGNVSLIEAITSENEIVNLSNQIQTEIISSVNTTTEKVMEENIIIENNKPDIAQVQLASDTVQQQISPPPIPRIIVDVSATEASPGNILADSADSNLDIFSQDPNENIMNPFTSGSSVEMDYEPVVIKKAPVIEKRVTRRSLLNSKIPATTQFYSPVLRKSLERKTKMLNKPATRRTLYDDANKPSTSSMGKTPTKIPKPKIVSKPKLFKCTIARCSAEFPSLKAFQEHQKTHKPTNISQSSFNCKFCDKKFQLEAALFNHQTDKCLQIPFNEKRKILSLRDERDKDKRRTTMFTKPVSKTKTPTRKNLSVVDNRDKNKSGITVTPKRSLKCHICQLIIPDALSLANHILSHKFAKESGKEDIA